MVTQPPPGVMQVKANKLCQLYTLQNTHDSHVYLPPERSRWTSPANIYNEAKSSARIQDRPPRPGALCIPPGPPVSVKGVD